MGIVQFLILLVWFCCKLYLIDGNNDAIAMEKAKFALSELQKLSETSIYSTLSIQKAFIEGEHDGIFHYNTILSLDLYSPFFASKKESEHYRMVLMTHKHTNITTLAIDEFPVMDEDAIEQFYIQMVKEKRKLYRKEMEILDSETEIIHN